MRGKSGESPGKVQGRSRESSGKVQGKSKEGLGKVWGEHSPGSLVQGFCAGFCVGFKFTSNAKSGILRLLQIICQIIPKSSWNVDSENYIS